MHFASAIYLRSVSISGNFVQINSSWQSVRKTNNNPIHDQSQQRNNLITSEMCSKLTIKRPEQHQRCLCISHFARQEKCQSMCFILGKRKKSKFNRLQIEVSFLPKISFPPPPNIGILNLSFARIHVGFFQMRHRFMLLLLTYLKQLL